MFSLIFVFQECTHYNFINDSDRAITNSNKQFKCDKTLTSGWYRFHGHAGQQMPTSCVAMNHCGANAPGWINGTHPTVAEGVSTVQVCFNWGNKCCRYSINIRVRNCNGFYVYELKKPPACRLRYCGNGAQGSVEKPNKTIQKNYNFLDCDWFIRLQFSINPLARLLSDSFLSHIFSVQFNKSITFKVVVQINQYIKSCSLN